MFFSKVILILFKLNHQFIILCRLLTFKWLKKMNCIILCDVTSKIIFGIEHKLKILI